MFGSASEINMMEEVRKDFEKSKEEFKKTREVFEKNKEYLGDGVYITKDPHWEVQLVLLTEGNVVYLDPEVQKNLVTYLTKAITEREG